MEIDENIKELLEAGLFLIIILLFLLGMVGLGFLIKIIC